MPILESSAARRLASLIDSPSESIALRACVAVLSWTRRAQRDDRSPSPASSSGGGAGHRRPKQTSTLIPPSTSPPESASPASCHHSERTAESTARAGQSVPRPQRGHESRVPDEIRKHAASRCESPGSSRPPAVRTDTSASPPSGRASAALAETCSSLQSEATSRVESADKVPGPEPSAARNARTAAKEGPAQPRRSPRSLSLCSPDHPFSTPPASSLADCLTRAGIASIADPVKRRIFALAALAGGPHSVRPP